MVARVGTHELGRVIWFLASVDCYSAIQFWWLEFGGIMGFVACLSGQKMVLLRRSCNNGSIILRAME
jgi:hypothetical protein